eukprot:EG_transcript_39468
MVLSQVIDRTVHDSFSRHRQNVFARASLGKTTEDVQRALFQDCVPHTEICSIPPTSIFNFQLQITGKMAADLRRASSSAPPAPRVPAWRRTPPRTWRGIC